MTPRRARRTAARMSAMHAATAEFKRTFKVAGVAHESRGSSRGATSTRKSGLGRTSRAHTVLRLRSPRKRQASVPGAPHPACFFPPRLRSPGKSCLLFRERQQARSFPTCPGCLRQPRHGTGPRHSLLLGPTEDNHGGAEDTMVNPARQPHAYSLAAGEHRAHLSQGPNGLLPDPGCSPSATPGLGPEWIFS